MPNIDQTILVGSGVTDIYSGRYEGDLGVAILGDSNSVGAGGETHVEANWSRVPLYQADGASVSAINTQAIPILNHPNTSPAPTGVGPGTAFLRRYAYERGAGRRVVAIPCGVYGTSFNTGQWLAGGAAWLAARSQVNAFLAANANNQLVAVLVSLGGNDSGISQAQLETWMYGLCDEIHGGMFTGSVPFSTTPVVWCQLPPAALPSVPGSTVVRDVINSIPAARTYTGVANADGLYGQNDNSNNRGHFTSMSMRELGGVRCWDAFIQAEANT
jgi:hypothetical protein